MRNEKMLSVDNTLLLVIDLQEAFRNHVPGFGQIVERTRILVEAARLLGVPVIVTEQYPKGLGQTVEELHPALDQATRFEKEGFSVFQDDAAREAILNSQRMQILMAGIESHVCVAQTALDALAFERMPFLAADAVGSRKELDRQLALDRLRQAGATITTSEAAILELTVASSHPQFRAISKLIKN